MSASSSAGHTAQTSVKVPARLFQINRSKPFDPGKFVGRNWSIVEEDERSLGLAELDFSKISFESGLKEDERYITGEEKLKRLTALPEIRLDAKIGQALYEEKGQATLRFLHDHFGVSWMEFAGTILRDSGGRRYFLYLYRFVGRSWDWSYSWLGYVRNRGSVSPLLAS
jgi:hypothetical protein